MVFASRALNDRRFWRAFALVAAFGLFAIGCGGKGDSSGGFGVPPPVDDPEGDTPGTAVVIVPDGQDFSGAINFGGDVDWFTFRAGEGITYTLQIFGFPPDPFLLPVNDLTGLGQFSLRAQIVSFDGLTQILNSTGSDAGAEYDVSPAGFPAPTGIFLGDSRIAWVAPTTNDFFIRVMHARVLTGSGHYVLHLSSSQLGITDTGISQSGGRDLLLFADDGMLLYAGPGFGTVGVAAWDFPTPINLAIFLSMNQVFFLDNNGQPSDTAEVPAFHFHWGIPDIFNPQLSLNFQGGNPHAIAYDFGNPPVWAPNPEIIRLMVGWPWYMDGHVTDDFDVLPTPVVVSWPFGPIYSLFESELAMSESNVMPINRSLFEAQRGANPDFTLFYDASSKTIQIARRTLIEPFPFGEQFISPADADSFAGDILTVYARGSGGFDPIVGASIIPDPKDPPELFDIFAEDSVASSPGNRNVIKQLSGAEAEALRDAYYETGIYFEVTDRITGQPISRADVAPLTPGLPSLEIQDVAFPEIIRPFRSNEGPLRKGIINFASDYAEGGQITVVSNGQVLGVLNDFLEAGQTAPECGEFHTSQTLAAEYWPHRYPYKAVAEDGTVWQGHFEIRSGACETLVLSVD